MRKLRLPSWKKMAEGLFVTALVVVMAAILYKGLYRQPEQTEVLFGGDLRITGHWDRVSDVNLNPVYVYTQQPLTIEALRDFNGGRSVLTTHYPLLLKTREI